MVTASFGILVDDFSITPTIPRPDPNHEIMSKAFYRIMTEHDLSRYTLTSTFGVVQIVVFKDHMTDFVAKLNKLEAERLALHDDAFEVP